MFHYLNLLLVVSHVISSDASTCPEDDPCRKDLDPDGPCEMIPKSCLSLIDISSIYDKCHYGANITINFKYEEKCESFIPERCKAITSRESQCKYCFQMDERYYHCENKEHMCNPKTSSPKERMITVDCEINPEVICGSNRKFKRKLPCSFTTGKRWETALILSITLGGFGADRFYLGYWREGLGKLFSFGGLGVWTIVDIILISVGYVAPADNSLYILT